MWGWFGGAAAQKRKDSPKSAILGLRSQLDMLQKRQQHLQRQIEEQEAVARKNVNTNKNAAMAALKRKKNHDRTLEQTNAQIDTLEQQINAIESANINRETLAAMEKAGQAMKHIHNGLTPEKVDETMDKLRVQNELSEEIVYAITSNNPGTEIIDEEDLERELEAMQQNELDEAMVKTGNVPVTDEVNRMPVVSNAEPVSKKKQTEEEDEEAEFRRLEAEMAM